MEILVNSNSIFTCKNEQIEETEEAIRLKNLLCSKLNISKDSQEFIRKWRISEYKMYISAVIRIISPKEINKLTEIFSTIITTVSGESIQFSLQGDEREELHLNGVRKGEIV